MHRTPSLLVGSLLALPLLAAPAPAQGGAVTNANVPRDNQKASNLNFERAQLQPLELSADGTRLYALNSPGARVAVFDVASRKLVLEIPIGIGAVSLARRPGTDELWVVDEIASTVLVISGPTATIQRSIRVGGLPHGIAFTPSGDRAYVTCSGVDRVDVIDATAKAVVKSIPVPVVQPRGIVWASGHAWLVPLLSGNNTATYGVPGDPAKVVGVDRITAPGLNALPDRDLLAISTQPDPSQDDLVPALTRSGLGTILFNVNLRPGTNQLWVPGTEALNAEHKGEKSFIAGQVVSNRIAVVDLSGTQPPVLLDLDALCPQDQRLAQPAHVSFDAGGQRAYVSGFGTDLIGVFDVLPGPDLAWVGAVHVVPKSSYPRGCGPRATLLSPDGATLFVYNRFDNSISPIDLVGLPASTPFYTVTSPGISLGMDPVSDEERLGRFLFTNARFSKSMTSSCASCHVDGHVDGIAWDLSMYLDPEGTPPGQVSFPLDQKGPLVTQSTRRLQETGPYHWRGERRSLMDFQVAFTSLLENQVGGAPAPIGPEFQYLRHYINNLHYPPNPRAALDRDYTPEQLAGADVFMNKPVLGTLTCASCHQLPLGTSGEIVGEVTNGMLQSADVPALRGVGDKASAPHMIGGVFGRRTELGVGFSHGGALSTLREAVLRPDPALPGGSVFDLTPQEADQVTAFLEAFDTGIAPAAGYIATAHLGNLAVFAQTELSFLEDQAERGNCDLIFLRGPRKLPSGGLVYLAGQYNPVTKRYKPASSYSPELSQAAVLGDVLTGRPVTFVGLPLGMGRAIGLDRDMDGLLDLDEVRHGSNRERFDTDGDQYPDGYEVQWGMDPTQPDTSSPDHQPPVLNGPARVLWTTTNTVKFEFETNEMSRVLVSYNGGYPVQRVPLGLPDFVTEHQVVLDGLEPDMTYVVHLELFDPSGNKQTDKSLVVQTDALQFGTPSFVDEISLSIQPGSSPSLTAQVRLETGSQPAGAGYIVTGAVYRLSITGALSVVSLGVTSPTGPKGVVRLKYDLPQPGLPSTLIFVLTDVQSPGNGAPYVQGMSHVSHATTRY